MLRPNIDLDNRLIIPELHLEDHFSFQDLIFEEMRKKYERLLSKLFIEALRQKLNIIIENESDLKILLTEKITSIEGLNTLGGKKAISFYYDFADIQNTGIYLFSISQDLSNKWDAIGNTLTGRVQYQTDLKINHADYGDTYWEGWEVPNLEQARGLGKK